MDSSDEKSCEGVTHVCDPNVKFGCKDSGEKRTGGTSDAEAGVAVAYWGGEDEKVPGLHKGPWEPKS